MTEQNNTSINVELERPVELNAIAQLLDGNINTLRNTSNYKGNEFINKLAELMQEYNVTKIDVSWNLCPQKELK